MTSKSEGTSQTTIQPFPRITPPLNPSDRVKNEEIEEIKEYDCVDIDDDLFVEPPPDFGIVMD